MIFREYTLPHALQWCRRLVKVKRASHCIQLQASASGTQRGATLPSWVITTFKLELQRGAGLKAPGPTSGGEYSISAPGPLAVAPGEWKKTN